MSHRVLEPAERFCVAFSGDLDATVPEIAHPTRDPFAAGGIGGEVPKADALDASADEISPRHTHRPYDSIRRLALIARA